VQKEKIPSNSDIKLYPVPVGDPMGISVVHEAIEDFRPDVLFCHNEPGGLMAYSMGIPAEYLNRLLSCMPIEGEPIAKAEHRSILSQTEFFTVSRFGVEVVRKSIRKNVEFAYEGVDHEVFRPDKAMRDAVRKSMKLEERFVINVTATNVRRKQLPRLLEAVAHLRFQFKQEDIVLYVHAVPFMSHWLEGWNLPEIAALYGISDLVRYHPLLQESGDYVQEKTDDPENPGLVEMYNASDLFVLPSQVEGFGLPIAEAMSCGLPVLVTKYGAGWEVASPAGHGIPVHDWEISRNGARYANVSPFELAKAILRLKRDPKGRQRMSESGLRRSEDFTWEPFQKLNVSLAEAMHGNEARRHSPEETHQDEERSQEEEVDIQQVQT
jgi:glycosyltransferase involved in cell wall biosynthesis